MEQGERRTTAVVAACPTQDGAGVKLRRSIASPAAVEFFDPFVLFHEFSNRNRADYIAGFPFHPHWGVEAVTYMTDGVLHYDDGRGRAGILRAGGFQWITSGGGMGHLEMLDREGGEHGAHHDLVRGFQLWINQPGFEKSAPARYQIFEPEEIPTAVLDNGVHLRVLAGGAANLTGPVKRVATFPIVMDITLPAQTAYTQALPVYHAAFVYPFEGELILASQSVPSGYAAFLDFGPSVTLRAGGRAVRALLVAGRPLNESVVRHGGFVMNSIEQIHRCVQDYHSGRF